MADSNPPSGLFSFFGNTPQGATQGATNYGALEARRKIALQLMAQGGRKGYPKTLGEGLASIGDNIKEMAMMSALQDQEAAYQTQLNTIGAQALPGEARAAPASATTGPRADATPADTDVTPPAEAETTPQSASADFKAPAYLKDVIAQNEPDPAMRAYYGQIALKEAQSPDEVSPTGAKGPFQFTRGTGKQYGLNGSDFDNRADPQASMKAMQAFTKDNMATLTDKLGRPPSMGELALAHQQGAGTAARMLAGTGNAPPQNLAVNNVAPGASPGAAADKIMAYYGMPNTPLPGGRDAIATAVMSRPPGPSDAAQEARVADVIGFGKGPVAASYPPTASRTDIATDAPALGLAGGPALGQAVGDTVQQRDQALKALRPPAVGVPPPNPTSAGAIGSPSMIPVAGSPDPRIAQNRPIPSDIKPVPSVPRAPFTELPQRPTPSPITAQNPPPPPAPTDLPMSDDEKRGYRLLSQFPGDPIVAQQAKTLIDYGQKQRDQEYQARLKTYEENMSLYNQQVLARETFNRGAPERELERKAKEADIAQKTAFGGLSEQAVLKPVDDSAKAVSGIPAGQAAVRNALRVMPNIFAGATADIKLPVEKLLTAVGFPVNPGISPTEQFKAFIMPALAAARQAQSGGANISDNDMALAAKAVAGDIKLEPDSIRAILEQLERTNLKAAIWHQSKVEGAAGDDPQRQATLLRMYGLPMEDLVHPDALKYLREHPTPDVVRQFNSKYHTPGFGERVLGAP